VHVLVIIVNIDNMHGEELKKGTNHSSGVVPHILTVETYPNVILVV